MNLNELANELKKAHENADDGDMVAQIIIFGIKYASEIINGNYTPKEIVKKAGMNIDYKTEIYKGIKLSKFVTLI
jgi:hypothetical protein